MGDTGGDDSSDDPDELEDPTVDPYQDFSRPSAAPCSERGPVGVAVGGLDISQFHGTRFS